MSKPTAFPLDESKLPFEIPKDAVLREKIVKLGQMITDRIPAKNRPLTAEDPEYWGLASIVTDEMADVALKMKVRKPMTLPEIVKATGKTAEELEPLCTKCPALACWSITGRTRAGRNSTYCRCLCPAALSFLT